MEQTITLAHGAGGKQTNDLIGGIFKKYFDNKYLTADDAAVLPPPNGRMAMSTDGFIVSPAEFPGGNIGKLSICGTVNDLACMGAKPLYISCAFVIEEGFSVEKLNRIANAMAETAHEDGVSIVSGVNPAGANAEPGDKIIVTGDVGRHGCTILLERDRFGMEANVTSDCAPLWNAVNAALEAVPDIHVIRDATRGGVGTVLYEIADQSDVGIKLDTESIPVNPEVAGVTGMLGLEPLYLACEGRLVMFVPAKSADAVLAALHSSEHTEGAVVIGEVTNEMPGHVVMTTEIGTETLLPPPSGELLPRIC